MLFRSLALLASSLSAFLVILGDISFSIGTLILVPYAAILIYGRFVGIDTTQIVSSILGGSIAFGAKAIISVVILMMLRTYTIPIILLAISLLTAGIINKIYVWRLKRKDKSPKTKNQKPNDGPSEDEPNRLSEKNKSTKQILDELEEMHDKMEKDRGK